jgi:hypothetical protein
MHFLGHELRDSDYCHCKDRKGHTAVVDDEGYWDFCTKCNRPIMDGFHYYNHYDGEDHCDIDMEIYY